MYFKYRSLANLEFALDILVNHRLFASEFTKLNDPMEGLFTYGNNEVPKWITTAIQRQKLRWRVLSLCESPHNMLMWSYYSDGHKGMVIGADLAEPRVKAESVQYVEDFNIEVHQEDVGRAILLRKHKSWRHEKEHRVLVEDRPFVKIRVREMVFGIEANPGTRELLSLVARKFNPGVKISSMTAGKLNTGSSRYRARNAASQETP
jgi:hypothetical protein